MKFEEIEILIVGGGPAGLSTWLHLQQINPQLAAQTLLIEKAVYPRDKLCGGGIVPSAERVLKRLGIEILVPSVVVEQVNYVFGSKSFQKSGRAFRVVRRREFDHLLARTAKERGLNLHEGELFLGFRRDRHGLLVKTDRGAYRTRGLVGADGALSKVRTAMNISQDVPRVSLAVEVLTAPSVLRNSDVAARTAVFDFSPVAQGLQGYVWDFPCVESGRLMFNRGVYDSRVWGQRPKVSMSKIFASTLKKRRAFRAPSTWSGHPGRWFDRDGVFANPNVLLVGDAAGAEPSFGEGISFALRYGGFAADYLIRCFRRSDLSFKDYRSRLIASPMGIELLFEKEIARQMYGGAPGALKTLYEQFKPQFGSMNPL
jgi:flavin-dependent dehydrogenase